MAEVTCHVCLSAKELWQRNAGLDRTRAVLRALSMLVPLAILGWLINVGCVSAQDWAKIIASLLGIAVCVFSARLYCALACGLGGFVVGISGVVAYMNGVEFTGLLLAASVGTLLVLPLAALLLGMWFAYDIRNGRL